MKKPWVTSGLIAGLGGLPLLAGPQANRLTATWEVRTPRSAPIIPLDPRRLARGKTLDCVFDNFRPSTPFSSSPKRITQPSAHSPPSRPGVT